MLNAERGHVTRVKLYARRLRARYASGNRRIGIDASQFRRARARLQVTGTPSGSSSLTDREAACRAAEQPVLPSATARRGKSGRKPAVACLVAKCSGSAATEGSGSSRNGIGPACHGAGRISEVVVGVCVGAGVSAGFGAGVDVEVGDAVRRLLGRSCLRLMSLQEHQTVVPNYPKGIRVYRTAS